MDVKKSVKKPQALAMEHRTIETTHNKEGKRERSNLNAFMERPAMHHF